MSIGKVEIWASTGKVESEAVQEKGPGEYRERIESGRVPENHQTKRG